MGHEMGDGDGCLLLEPGVGLALYSSANIDVAMSCDLVMECDQTSLYRELAVIMDWSTRHIMTKAGL